MGAAGVVGGLAVASMAMGVISSYQQAQQAKEAARFNAETQRINADLAEREAEDTEAVGLRQLQALQQQQGQAAARQRSALAATGVDIDTGSALQLREDVAGQGMLDQVNLRENIDNTAYRNRMAAYSANLQGEILDTQASSISPLMAATTSALGSAAAFAPTAYAYRDEFGSWFEPEPPIPQRNPRR